MPAGAVAMSTGGQFFRSSEFLTWCLPPFSREFAAKAPIFA
jgi:hypothetical protein